MKYLITLAAILLFSNQVMAQMGASITAPHYLVYKTKSNYNNLVPVTLSPDKKTIVSYPDPKDIHARGDKILPTQLHKDYLLDNRGIAENVAFLKLTYAQFAALPNAPSMDEMLGMIVDNNPLISLCDCGQRQLYTNPVDQFNVLIDNKKLKKTCKELVKTKPKTRKNRRRRETVK